jgi:hypothetical protein
MAGFLEKLRNLSDAKKKIIIICTVALFGLGLGSGWVLLTISRLSNAGDFLSSLQLPEIPALSKTAENVQQIFTAIDTTSSQNGASIDTSTWKDYENSNAKFSLKYPNSWNISDEKDNGSYKTIALIGSEGAIKISYGQGFSGSCTATHDDVIIDDKESSACHVVNNDETEQWDFIIDDKTSSMGIFASAYAPYDQNRDIILNILYTIKFTK